MPDYASWLFFRSCYLGNAEHKQDDAQLPSIQSNALEGFTAGAIRTRNIPE